VHETYQDRRRAHGVAPAEIRIETAADERRAHDDRNRRAGRRSARSRRCRSRSAIRSIPTTSSRPTAPTPRAGSCCRTSPPERDVIWSEEGVQGASRFVQKVWRLVGEADGASGYGCTGSTPPGDQGCRTRPSWPSGDDVERLRFNRCIAHVHDLSNAISAAIADAAERELGAVDRSVRPTRIMVQLFAPMMPHLAEQCWAELGGGGLIANAAWPVANPAFVAESDNHPARSDQWQEAGGSRSADQMPATPQSKPMCSPIARSFRPLKPALSGRSLSCRSGS